MSKYSKKIINFLTNNNTIHKIDIKLPFIDNKTHSSNTKLLEECILEPVHSDNEKPLVYQLSKSTLDLKEYAKLYNTNKTQKYVPEDTNKCRNILIRTMYNNTFVSLDVLQEIEISKLTHKKYLIDDKHTVDIFIKYDNLDLEPDINKIGSIINTISHILNKDKIVNLVVFYGNQKKLIGNNTEIINCEHVNSGATYVDKIIIIWRKEEFYKVLTHELLHYFDYYKELDCNLPIVLGNDLTNEAYVENMATLINCSLNNGDPNIEFSFMLFQIAKIIYIFGGKTFDDYLSNRIIISQTTNVRSYYILKTLLFVNKDTFEQEWIDTINKYITLLHLTTYKKWIHKTMRMTVY